jgi:photosystem II stability/assembly factor-like uncharacterized protein
MLHYDGKSWSLVNSPTQRTLLNISFSRAGDGYIVGRGGDIFALHNGKWSRDVDLPTHKTLYAISNAPDGLPWIAATSRDIFKRKS